MRPALSNSIEADASASEDDPFAPTELLPPQPTEHARTPPKVATAQRGRETNTGFDRGQDERLHSPILRLPSPGGLRR